MPNKYNIQAHRQELDRLIRERAWNAFRIRFKDLSNLENCRSVVLDRKSKHRSLLHYICDLDDHPPPSDVVALVAAACPQALFASDSNRRLPLHLALRRPQVGIRTVEALIDSVPSCQDYCESPYSVEKLLLHRDSSGSTPLLVATKSDNAERREEIIKFLVNRDTSGQSMLPKKSNGKKQQHKSASSPLRYVASRETLFVDDGLHSSQDLLRFMIVKTYYCKMTEVMENIYSEKLSFDPRRAASDEDSEVCLLQAAIVCHDLFGSVKMASSIISAVIRNGLFHKHHRDCQGNSTLHVACLCETHRFDQVLKLGRRETDYGINSEDGNVMEHLIGRSMASFVNFIARNHFGDIPLHCAIRAGRDIVHIRQLLKALEQSSRICTRNGELPIHLALKHGSASDVVMTLWRAYKDAALVVDKSTGLYPFQLAAAAPCFGGHYFTSNRSKKRRNANKNADEHIRELEMSYFFLRERPEVITFFRRAFVIIHW